MHPGKLNLVFVADPVQAVNAAIVCHDRPVSLVAVAAMLDGVTSFGPVNVYAGIGCGLAERILDRVAELMQRIAVMAFRLRHRRKQGQCEKPGNGGDAA